MGKKIELAFRHMKTYSNKSRSKQEDTVFPPHVPLHCACRHVCIKSRHRLTSAEALSWEWHKEVHTQYCIYYYTIIIYLYIVITLGQSNFLIRGFPLIICMSHIHKDNIKYENIQWNIVEEANPEKHPEHSAVLVSVKTWPSNRGTEGKQVCALTVAFHVRSQ